MLTTTTNHEVLFYHPDLIAIPIQFLFITAAADLNVFVLGILGDKSTKLLKKTTTQKQFLSCGATLTEGFVSFLVGPVWSLAQCWRFCNRKMRWKFPPRPVILRFNTQLFFFSRSFSHEFQRSWMTHQTIFLHLQRVISLHLQDRA